MIKCLMLSSLLALSTMASGGAVPPAADAGPTCGSETSRGLYYASGTARVVSSISGREITILVWALITADSLSEARSHAPEALSADAANWGRVIQVHVRMVY